MTNASTPDINRVCVVIPTYNNADSLGDVIRDVLTVTDNIVVTDDGCTDETSTVLAAFPDLIVVRHARNRGKGAALASGFAAAADRGFTHVLSFDADGQHAAKDIPRMLDAARGQPDAIVVGVRDLSGWGRPLASRLLRAHSNMWIWLITGRWIADTQTGMRVFPLDTITKLRQTCNRYDYEVEILIRAVWHGTPVVGVPISVTYGPPGQSRFRRGRDSILVMHLWIILLMQRVFLPLPLRQTLQDTSVADSRRTWRQIPHLAWSVFMHECRRPARLSASLAVGVTAAILPIWGLQTIAAAVVAHALRLSKKLAIAASALSFPALIPFIIYASYRVGRAILGRATPAGEWPGPYEDVTAMTCATEYVVGAIVLAIAAGAATFALSFILAAWLRATSTAPSEWEQSCEE